jgi:hypothetical protein
MPHEARAVPTATVDVPAAVAKGNLRQIRVRPMSVGGAISQPQQFSAGGILKRATHDTQTSGDRWYSGCTIGWQVERRHLTGRTR